MAFIVLTVASITFYPLVTFLYPKSKAQQAKKTYCALMAILFITFIGLRSKNVGIDSLDYANSFNEAPKISWDVFIGFLKSKEFLYHTLQSLVRTITPSYTVWFLIIAIAYTVPLSCFIYKYSNAPYLSFILFMSMAYMNFAMAGLRQTFATSFLIVGFLCLLKRKYIKFLFFVLIASCFHITAAVFALAVFVPRGKIRMLDYILFFAVLAIAVVFGRQLVELALSFVFKDTRSYTTDEYGGISTFVLLFVIAFAALLFNKELTEENSQKSNSDDKLMFRLLLIAIPVQWLAIYQANCFRIAMYFSLFPVLTIIPNAICKQKDIVIKSVGKIALLGLLMIQLFVFTYNLSGVNPYEFFWQAL